MNRFQRIVCALLLGSVLACAASSGEAYAAVVANGQDDISNSCAAATVLPWNTVVADEINFVGDVDCFRRSDDALPKRNMVTVLGGLNVDCSVTYTYNGITRVLPDSKPFQPDCVINWDSNFSTYYLVRVSGYGGAYSNDKAYMIKISSS